jgi:hypothetical protein
MISFVLLLAAFAAASAFTPSRFAARQRVSINIAYGEKNLNSPVAIVFE